MDNDKEKEFLASLLNLYSYVAKNLDAGANEELESIKGQAMVKATELYMWTQLFFDSKNRSEPKIKGMMTDEPNPNP